MPTPPISNAEHKRRYDAIRAAVSAGYAVPDYPPNGRESAINAAAAACGLPRGTMNSWWSREGRKRFGAFPERHPASVSDIEPVSRAETRDARFWQAKCASLSRDLDQAEKIAEELAGLRSFPVPRVDWLAPATTAKSQTALALMLSDVHMGEVIDPEEVGGLNAFNEEICQQRLRRFFQAAVHVGKRCLADSDCRGAVLMLGGDMISGDIHEELRVTNCLTSQEQVMAVVAEVEQGIRIIQDAFGPVLVVSVPGNHSRVTHKPTAKLYSRASYDTMIAAILADRLKGDGGIRFQFGPDKDQSFNAFGFEHFVTHGDKIGTRGGMGFAGPFLPIVRGAKKIEAQQASAGRRPDFIWHGHYHTLGNAGNVFSNGSVPGYSEFASDLRASIEPPMQWLAVLHSEWGVRERVPIHLDPPKRVKPRVSVRAAA